MGELCIIPMKDWTKEMFKISESVSNNEAVTYKTTCNYIIINESSNVIKKTVYFINL